MVAEGPRHDASRRPFRLVQVGLGSMGRTWLDAIEAHPDAELVGVVDLDAALATRVADERGLAPAGAGTDLADLDLEADAVVVVTVPAAHREVSAAALRAGLPVLCEKPAAPTVAEAMRMAATSRSTGQALVVSQSRRFLRGVAAMRRALADLGEIATISCAFHRDPHFGGFRERMAHPLLVDMAIHHLDLARLLVGSPPLRVHATSTNPSWSWYAGDAVADALFTFTEGARFDYAGSWVARGAQSSWNGTWRISAEHGSLAWDGEGAPTMGTADGRTSVLELGDEPEEVDGSLAAFLALLDDPASGRALRDEVPHSDIGDNVHSLAMVEAAVQAADSGDVVSITALLDDARRTAHGTEQDPRVRAHLATPSRRHDRLSGQP